MHLFIDSRETNLITQIRTDFSDIQFTVQQLDVGDIQIVLEGSPVCIVERKEVNDLASSIYTGRRKEQTIRLKASNTMIIYLIEGESFSVINYANLSDGALWGAALNSLIRDKFTVFRTMNLSETAIFVVKLFQKCQEHLTNQTPIVAENYTSSIKIKKKDNLTPKNVFILQLAQITGVSVSFAEKIAEKYSCMANLFQCYSELPTETDKKTMLKNIQVTTKRKLGPTLSERIYCYMFNSL